MLKKADPRAKLAVVSAISTLAIFSNGLNPLFILTIITLLLLPLFSCDIKKTLGYLKGFLTVMVSLAVIQSIFTRGGEPLLQLGNIVLLTQNGVMVAGSFLLRMVIITFSASILGTSSSREIIQGLVQMKVPYELAFMASMGLRFLPALRDQFRDVLVAMELRGIDFKAASFSQKLQLLGHMFTPVVAGAILASRQISISVQLRGFRAFPQRSSHFTLHFNARDTAMVALTAVFTVLFLVLI
ncbi:MAG: energy-coupling factor transporter transmembrane component T [Angelakisella sp.]